MHSSDFAFRLQSCISPSFHSLPSFFSLCILSQIIKVVSVPLKVYASSSEVKKHKGLKRLPVEVPATSVALADSVPRSSMNDLTPLVSETPPSFSRHQGEGPSGTNEGSVVQGPGIPQTQLSGKHVEDSLRLVTRWCQVKVQWELLLCQFKVRSLSHGKAE